MKPVVVDIECSGIDFVKCGIWQIGAIDLETGEEFLDEARIDDEDKYLSGGNKSLFEVIGKTEAELRDESKQSQKELLKKFFKWFKKREMKNLVCQNPQFDFAMLKLKAEEYDLKIPFHYRAFDTHSIAHTIYYKKNKKFLINDEENFSEMNLANVLKMCGMQDNRKEHNALEDAKLTAECFSRLMFGENFLDEYSNYEIPENLKN
jgi:DNA polymerase III epsilon subunit-like protein